MVAKTVSSCCARFNPHPDSDGFHHRSETSKEYGVSAKQGTAASAKRAARTERRMQLRPALIAAVRSHAPDELVDVHEPQVEVVVGAQPRLDVLAHRPRP